MRVISFHFYSQHFISYDNVRTNFFNQSDAYIVFFLLFFHNNFEAYLEKYKFDHCVISVGTQDQLLLCIQLN